MRLHLIVLSILLFTCASSKNSVKSLTESMGQEVIEIGSPIKELPADIEEEPSAELDGDEKTTITTQTTTRKITAKTTNLPDTRRKDKEIDKKDSLKPEDEEARIEKELAEIYKDNIDYKDSSESVKEMTTTSEEVAYPALRQRTGKDFKFQPDVTNKAAIEKFRTSVDDISCGKLNKLTVTESTNSGSQLQVSSLKFGFTLLIVANFKSFVNH
ncbi:uncharacterized protein LOC113513992 [Galleria mellonella]|uniref:Uncharacterized protein LOC113513992 n=1 Tax=Galleria mellonella TaxID=7137 RepID=A0A6J3C9S3_GALME|nr:uncharacterized protein LOC113513992 [Galleria mellonella]